MKQLDEELNDLKNLRRKRVGAKGHNEANTITPAALVEQVRESAATGEGKTVDHTDVVLRAALYHPHSKLKKFEFLVLGTYIYIRPREKIGEKKIEPECRRREEKRSII